MISDGRDRPLGQSLAGLRRPQAGQNDKKKKFPSSPLPTSSLRSPYRDPPSGPSRQKKAIPFLNGLSETGETFIYARACSCIGICKCTLGMYTTTTTDREVWGLPGRRTPSLHHIFYDVFKL